MGKNLTILSFVLAAQYCTWDTPPQTPDITGENNIGIVKNNG